MAVTVTFDVADEQDRLFVLDLAGRFQYSTALLKPSRVPPDAIAEFKAAGADFLTAPAATAPKLDAATIKKAVLARIDKTSRDEALAIVTKYGTPANGDKFAKVDTVPPEKYADLYAELTNET